MMSMSRWQAYPRRQSHTLPSRKRLTIALTNDLAGNGLLGMKSNAASNGFDSRILLTLSRTAGSLLFL